MEWYRDILHNMADKQYIESSWRELASTSSIFACGKYKTTANASVGSHLVAGGYLSGHAAVILWHAGVTVSTQREADRGSFVAAVICV